MESAKKLLGIGIERFSSSIWGYLNLWSYWDMALKHRIASRQTHKIKSCLEFYAGIKSGLIKHGDKIVLKDFFLSEWLPRAAGGLASLIDNPTFGIEDYNCIPTSFRPGVKRLSEGDLIPPMGSIRFPLVKNKDIMMGLVTAHEFHADLGIPVAVSPYVYSHFLSKQLLNNSVEVNAECYVDLLNGNDNIPIMPEIDEQVKSNSISAPSIILRIPSMLQIQMRSHTSHPRISAWFLRRIENHENKIIGLKGIMQNGRIRTMNRIYAPQIEYDYFHWTIFENNPEEILMVRDLMTKFYSGFSTVGNYFDKMDKDEAYEIIGFPIDEGEMKDHRIKSVAHLTEFDGRQNIIQPIISFHLDQRRVGTQNINILKEVHALEQK